MRAEDGMPFTLLACAPGYLCFRPGDEQINLMDNDARESHTADRAEDHTSVFRNEHFTSTHEKPT